MPTANNVNFYSDWQAQQEDITRQRMMAQMLQQEGMQAGSDQATQAGGYTVKSSPLQGLAKLLDGYGGMKGQQAATERSRALNQKYQMTGNEALIRGLQAYR